MMQLDLEGRSLLLQIAEACSLFLIRDIDAHYSRLGPLLLRAQARLPTPEAAAAAATRPHTATRLGALVGDLLEIVWVGLNVSLAWYHAISRSLGVAGYMGMAGDAVARARPLLLRLVQAVAEGLDAALPEPLPWNGLYQLIRPLSFFAAVQELPGVAAHFDSSFGHSWFPAWRVENRSREMLDHAAYDALFQRALAELAGGLAEAAPWGEWWPYGGTLLSLMRHGALVGELAEGVWDASVGKDMEIMVGVSSPEEWDTVANKLASLYEARYRWTCSTHRLFGKEFPGLSGRNDSLICRAPARLHPCLAHERFCAYRPDFQITGYFRDSAAQALYVHKVDADVGAALGCEPRRGLGTPAAVWSEESVCRAEGISKVGRIRTAEAMRAAPDGGWYVGSEPLKHWAGAVPWKAIYPLGSCKAMDISIPCPVRPIMFLESSKDVGGSPCRALPWITRDRRVDDGRNHELAARGLTRQDVRVLRERADLLQRQGFVSFAEHFRSPACAQLLEHSEGPGEAIPTFTPAEDVELIDTDGIRKVYDDRDTEDPVVLLQRHLFRHAELVCDCWSVDVSEGGGMPDQTSTSRVFWRSVILAHDWLLMPTFWQSWSLALPQDWVKDGVDDFLDLVERETGGPLLGLLLKKERQTTLAALLLVSAETLISYLLPAALLGENVGSMLSQIWTTESEWPTNAQLRDLLHESWAEAVAHEAPGHVIWGFLKAWQLFRFYLESGGGDVWPRCLEWLVHAAFRCARDWRFVAERQVCST